MAYCDFVVKYDPNKDTKIMLTERIIYSVIVGRLKARKPAVIFLGGDSGEGKSYAGLRLIEIILKTQNIDYKAYMENCNVFTPLEYAEKLDALLYDKALRKINTLLVHEARETVKARLWYTFINQAISDINAMSRAIKRLCFIVVSQFIRDISKEVRYTLNYYCMVRRPKGEQARLYIYALWKDDRDLEAPKLRKRKLSGFIVYPNGSRRKYTPSYIELKQPEKDIRDWFNKRDSEAKSIILKQKLNRLIKEIKEDVGVESKKVIAMTKYYTENLSALSSIGKQFRGKWKLNKNVQEMHELTKVEIRMFEEKLNQVLKEKGVTHDRSDGL